MHARGEVALYNRLNKMILLSGLSLANWACQRESGATALSSNSNVSGKSDKIVATIQEKAAEAGRNINISLSEDCNGDAAEIFTKLMEQAKAQTAAQARQNGKFRLAISTNTSCFGLKASLRARAAINNCSNMIEQKLLPAVTQGNPTGTSGDPLSTANPLSTSSNPLETGGDPLQSSSDPLQTNGDPLSQSSASNDSETLTTGNLNLSSIPSGLDCDTGALSGDDSAKTEIKECALGNSQNSSSGVSPGSTSQMSSQNLDLAVSAQLSYRASERTEAIEISDVETYMLYTGVWNTALGIANMRAKVCHAEKILNQPQKKHVPYNTMVSILDGYRDDACIAVRKNTVSFINLTLLRGGTFPAGLADVLNALCSASNDKPIIKKE
jgi:hypothetical protein